MRTLGSTALAALLLFLTACGNSTGPLNPDAAGAGMSAVVSELQTASFDDGKKKKLRDKELGEKSGAAFFGAAIRLEILDPSITKWLVIPESGDAAADGAAVKASGELPAASCSYACPKARNLLVAMSGKGSKKKVVLCPNSRNWKRYGDAVPVYFSDGNAPVKLTFDEAAKSFSITRDEWNDPAGKLFGKKAPFDMVGE
ncbi:MAG: hypothetical protein IT461_02065 [Planctomycetes bacterium]|nr:hypothetical protein [Planctomycetota bacterium]